MAMTDRGVEDLNMKLLSIIGNPETLPVTKILLSKVSGLLTASSACAANQGLSKKLERAAISTLLRGYGVKNAPRGKR